MKRIALWTGIAVLGVTCASASTTGQATASHGSTVQNLPIVFEPAADTGSEVPAMMARTGQMSVRMRAGGLTVLPADSAAGALEIEFAGSRPAVPEGADLLESHTNYLLGNDESRWRRHVANYARVRYHALYQGIDAVFYGKGPRLEHDFIVDPGADYRQIRLRFPKDARVEVSGDGVTVKLGGAEFAMDAPMVYQEGAHGREMRAGSFRRVSEGEVGFAVSSYDRTRPLVIDPVLTYETYLSQYANDVLAVATNAAGETFVTGYGSYQMPTTAGSFSGCATCTANEVVTFVSKLSADGSKLIYSTILGGNSFAQPTGIAADAAGNAIVSGWTAATDFPTKLGQPVDKSNNNYFGFLFSLAPDGSALNYGTLIGATVGTQASPMTYAMAVALDGSGNAYVTGETGHGFPVTTGALNNEMQGMGSYNSFLVYLQKFTPKGDLVYSAILGTADPQSGGGGPIGASAIAVDSAGEAFVSGQAGSLWPTTSKAYHTALPANDTYAAPFVAKVSSDASTLVYSTFLDYAYALHGMEVLANGNVFVTGQDPDPSYPTTPDAFEPIQSGSGSMLTELDSTGSSLVYSTGISGFAVNAMAIAPDGDVWLTGAGSDAFPLTLPLQGTFPISPLSGNGPAAMVAQFDAKGQKLKFSTVLGGPAVAFGSGIAIDGKNHAHVGGAASYTMYGSPGAYLGTVPPPGPGGEGWVWAFVAQIDPSVSAPAVCAKPDGGLIYGTVATGSSKDQSVTLTNCGATALTIADVAPNLPAYTVTTNTCTGQIAVGGTCNLTVRFAPTVSGGDSGWLKIDDNASMPGFIDLSGYGMDEPVASVSPTSITFGPQLVGTQSAARKITVTNSGRATLTFGSIGYNSARLDDFKFTTTCAISLDPGASCEIDFSFTPTVTGTSTAMISLYDSAGNQTVNATGTAPATPFSVGAQAGGSMTATVTAGTTANYALSLAAAGGYRGTVTLNCDGLPAHAACSFNPASIALTSASSTNFTLNVSTGSMAASAAAGSAVRLGVVFGLPFLLAAFSRGRKRGVWMAVALLGVAIASVTACGGSGGSSGSGGGGQSNTVAAGTYTLQVTAADGKSSQSQNVTLVVK